VKSQSRSPPGAWREQTFPQKELLNAFGLKTGTNIPPSKVDKGLTDIRKKSRVSDSEYKKSRIDRNYDKAMNASISDIMVEPGQFNSR